MVKLAIILCIALCLIIISGLVRTRVVDIITVDYYCDLIPDSRGEVRLLLCHQGVKETAYNIAYDVVAKVHIPLEKHEPIKLICYHCPLSSKLYIKEVWLAKHRIS